MGTPAMTQTDLQILYCHGFFLGHLCDFRAVTSRHNKSLMSVLPPLLGGYPIEGSIGCLCHCTKVYF